MIPAGPYPEVWDAHARDARSMLADAVTRARELGLGRWR